MPSVSKAIGRYRSVEPSSSHASSIMSKKSKTLKMKKKSLSSRIRRLLTSENQMRTKNEEVLEGNTAVKVCKECGGTECQQYVALDCEMVGVGPKAKQSALARCTVVDYHGQCLCDLYVKPDLPVTDYRTRWSGIRKEHIQGGLPFICVQNHIRKLIEDKIIIGHALDNDLRALELDHPSDQIRDTSECSYLKELLGVGSHLPVSLKKLSKLLLHRNIQAGEHSSLEDARAAMDLFKISQSTDSQLNKTFMNDHFWPTGCGND